MSNRTSMKEAMNRVAELQCIGRVGAQQSLVEHLP
jgi:hypothetical protein